MKIILIKISPLPLFFISSYTYVINYSSSCQLFCDHICFGLKEGLLLYINHVWWTGILSASLKHLRTFTLIHICILPHHIISQNIQFDCPKSSYFLHKEPGHCSDIKQEATHFGPCRRPSRLVWTKKLYNPHTQFCSWLFIWYMFW